MEYLANNELEGQTVILFSAEWCQPCKTLKRKDSEGKSVMDRLEEQFSDYKFYMVDVDRNKDFAIEQGIRSIPTMIAFNDQKPVGKKFGVDALQAYSQFISESFKHNVNQAPVVEQSKSQNPRVVEKHNPESKGFLHDMFGTGEENYKPKN